MHTVFTGKNCFYIQLTVTAEKPYALSQRLSTRKNSKLPIKIQHGIWVPHSSVTAFKWQELFLCASQLLQNSLERKLSLRTILKKKVQLGSTINF